MIRAVQQEYVNRVEGIVRVGVATLEDLRVIGDYLDLPCTISSRPKLASQARRIARQAVREYLRHDGSKVIAGIAGRSWVIGDIYHQELDQAEFEMNLEFKVA